MHRGHRYSMLSGALIQSRVLRKQSKHSRSSAMSSRDLPVIDLNFNVAVDYWRNAQRLTIDQAREFINSRRWWKVRPGVWACENAVVNLEIVPGTRSRMSALVWMVDL
jgi:hypothetical protein